MGESKTRILPPLVSGKLAGILEFVIDHVKFKRKDNFISGREDSFAIQILWWGETKPCYIGPFLKQFDNESIEKCKSQHERCSVKYEIRTKLKLFRSYLSKCDTIELVVVDMANNIIGSAFLKDIIDLVFSPLCFTSAFINCLGDIVGEITYHFIFSDVQLIQEISNKEPSISGLIQNKPLKINLNLLELNSESDDIFTEYISNATNTKRKVLSEEKIFGIHKKKTELLDGTSREGLHYNSPTGQNSNLQVTNVDASVAFANNATNENSNSVLEKSDENKLYSKNMNCDVTEKLSHAPIVVDGKAKEKKNTSLNKSKKLNFGQRQPKSNSTKARDKNRKSTNFTENLSHNKTSDVNEKNLVKKDIGTNQTLKAHKKDKIHNPARTRNDKMLIKTNDLVNSLVKKKTVKTFTGVSNEISKINKFVLIPLKSGGGDSDLEKVPVKEKSLINLKEANTDAALDNKDKKSEPTFYQNSANPSIVDGSFHTRTFHQRNQGPLLLNKMTLYHTVNNTNSKISFNLDDPVERIYYETFFLKSDPPNNDEFEIAQMLNPSRDEQENKYVKDMTEEEVLCDKSKDVNDFSQTELQVGVHKLKLVAKKTDVDSVNVNFNKTNLESCKDELPCCRSQYPSVKKNDMIEEQHANIERNRIVSCNKSMSNYDICGKSTYESTNTTRYVSNSSVHVTDCHQCHYYKKLKELDKIIESLKRFESRIMEEEGKHCYQNVEVEEYSSDNPQIKEDLNIIPQKNSGGQIKDKMEISEVPHTVNEGSQEEVSAEISSHESDFSRDDSDFIEFTHYMSSRTQH